MKNICITTWFRSGNYGTCLQALALYRTIENMGYDSYMLNYGRNYSLKNIDFIALMLLRKIREHKSSSVAASKDLQEKLAKVNKLINSEYAFKSIKGKKNFNDTIKSIDAFVVGSDQLWNPDHVQETFLLDFVNKDKLRISYATSMGVSKLPLYFRLKYRHRLTKFDSLSMREKSGADIIQDITKKNVSVVADPTFLLDEKEWNVLTDKYAENYPVPKHYILTYFVGGNISHWNEVKQLSKKLSLPVVNIPMDAGVPNFDCLNLGSAGPLDFVKLIRDSNFVCTDSFHAAAFSINYEKNFIIFKRFLDNDIKSQNSRLSDLLAYFGLTDRIWSGVDFNEQIDYASVKKRLTEYRETSICFLEDAIEGRSLR